MQPDSKSGLNRCFRLRQKGDQSFVAYKIDNYDSNGLWIYSDEHESQVQSFDKITEIINLLGLKELVRIDNEKYTYIYEDFEIVVEIVQNLGLFLEVEIINLPDEKDVLEAKQEIWEFIKSLGINVSEEFQIGKPELMLRKQKLKNN